MSIRSLASLAVSLSLVSAHPPSYGKKFSWDETKYLITFGDSYTYVQGLLGRTNATYIGDALNLPFTPQQLLSNRIVQNQTATAEGGPNWVEYLTGCGLKPGLTDPRTCKKQLWDFAFGGSDISTEYLPLHHDYTTSLVNQTLQFIQYGEPVLSKFVDKSKTLIGIWIGINDINDSAKLAVDFPSFYNTLQDTLFDRVEALYKLGYKKFLFMNLPPLDRTPSNTARGPAAALPNATMVNWWDSALANHSAAFAKEHRDVKTMLFDVNTFLNKVMDNHDAYQISNVTGYCASYNQPYIREDPASYGCKPLDQYFWFNTGHLTSHVHEILAAEVKRFLRAQS